MILLVLSTGLNKIKALGTALIFKLSLWSSNKGRVAVDAAKCPPADPQLAIILFGSINNEVAFSLMYLIADFASITH